MKAVATQSVTVPGKCTINPAMTTGIVAQLGIRLVLRSYKEITRVKKKRSISSGIFKYYIEKKGGIPFRIYLPVAYTQKPSGL